MREEPQYVELEGEFRIESGETLLNPVIAYHTFGKLSEARNNVVWVCHALTADSNVADWWPHTVEEGKFLDPSRYFVVCANVLGSCYGSTGPLSTNPATGKPYYNTFPRLTMGDWANAHRALAEKLGISQIRCLVGSSVGGFQALEWACREPERFEQMILIATSPKASPWTIAIDETQRMAIFADKTYGEPTAEAGSAGLAAARAIGLLTYRGGAGYNLSQQDYPDTPADTHRACTYQRYQGEKLCRRFNAYSYVSILNTFDTHDIGRNRGGVARALAGLGFRTCVVGISTDIIFTPGEMRDLAAMMPNAEYHEITSEFGHDGFLVEHEQLNVILKRFMSNDEKQR